MTNSNPNLKVWTDKPEAVIDWPACGLSKEQLDKYRLLSKLAIVEIAGRDSIAAAKQFVRDEGYLYLLPTYTYTATEYGSWDSVEHAVTRLAAGLGNTRVLPESLDESWQRLRTVWDQEFPLPGGESAP